MIAGLGTIVLSALPLLLCLAVVVGVPLLIILFTRSSGRKRDADLASQWEWVRAQAAQGRGHLAYVRHVYQRARSGSGAKAFIVWDGVSWDQDTWFKGRPHMPQGVWVLVRGSAGWGPHNRNPNTFFVGLGGVLAEIPGNAPAAYQRHQKRLAKRAKSGKTRS